MSSAGRPEQESRRAFKSQYFRRKTCDGRTCQLMPNFASRRPSLSGGVQSTSSGVQILVPGSTPIRTAARVFNVRTGEPTKAYAGSSKGSAESIARALGRDGYWKLAASRIRGTYRGTSITQSAGTAPSTAHLAKTFVSTSSFPADGFCTNVLKTEAVSRCPV